LAITTALSTPATPSYMTTGQGHSLQVSNAIVSSPPLLPITKCPGYKSRCSALAFTLAAYVASYSMKYSEGSAIGPSPPFEYLNKPTSSMGRRVVAIFFKISIALSLAGGRPDHWRPDSPRISATSTPAASGSTLRPSHY